MPRTAIVRETRIERSPRVMQIEGIFDVPEREHSRVNWDVDFELPAEWNIGVIVGPSGSGKTTVARELFGEAIVTGWLWGHGAIVDDFPREMSIHDITELLSNVGLSSPPVWLRPYDVLSNGERFRVDMARTLAERPDFAVVDEFSSVVDRTVAQVGSAAIARTARARGHKLILVTCHYDVLEWLEPDWVYEPHTNRLARDRLCRPTIELQIRRVSHRAWVLFGPHHYLTAQLNRSAQCYCAFWRGEPVGFISYLPFVGRTHGNLIREHRTVVLPDFQGVGIGRALCDTCAAAWKTRDKQVVATTSHPAKIHSYMKNSLWEMTRKPSFTGADSKYGLKASYRASRSTNRLTASFRYIGDALQNDDARFLEWD